MKGFDLARLGREIRLRRIALGWSLEDFAEACGMTGNYLGVVENGLRDPHIGMLVSIAKGLGCSVADLLVEPDGDVSPRGRQMGRLFDKISPRAQELVALLMYTLVKPRKEAAQQGEDAGKSSHPPGEGEPPP
jgi:transcriptional regulator with XRE-family HTH domain